jgi:vesicle transport protein SEC22
VYLVITDKSYPRKLAFSYVDELSKEFWTSYGPKVEGIRKPYAFVGFGEFIPSPRLNLMFTYVLRHIYVKDR